MALFGPLDDKAATALNEVFGRRVLGRVGAGQGVIGRAASHATAQCEL